MQQKEFAATPTPLGIEDEEEVTYQSAPITQEPAMQQTQKRSASKTTEGNASETTEGNASETTKKKYR